ncbi:hypothetical protein ACQZ48_20110 [Agrobacterium sp. 22-209-1]
MPGELQRTEFRIPDFIRDPATKLLEQPTTRCKAGCLRQDAIDHEIARARTYCLKMVTFAFGSALGNILQKIQRHARWTVAGLEGKRIEVV